MFNSKKYINSTEIAPASYAGITFLKNVNKLDISLDKVRMLCRHNSFTRISSQYTGSVPISLYIKNNLLTKLAKYHNCDKIGLFCNLLKKYWKSLEINND